MRFGPTSLQLSSVLAKGLHRPKLREDLRVSQQQVLGETSYVVKILDEFSYNRYGPLEFGLLKACDGTRTPAEIAEYMTEQDPTTPLTEQDVLEFLDGVDTNLWEKTIGEKNLAILERIRDERSSRVNHTNLLYIAFKAWNPDKTLARLDPYLSWMYTKAFALVSIALIIVAMSILARDWNRVAADTSSLYSFAGKSAYDIWAFWVIMLFLGAIHEFGHGLTCKHYGGEVPQMGFLLIYFTPAFYTDTTDILLFKRGSQRQWVIFAGIWIELVICGLSGVLWYFTRVGSVLNDVAYKMMLLSGIQGALLNLNPLIKADGYYALSQFLNIDNLREESVAVLRPWAEKYLLRHDIDLPPTSKRQRRVFFLFGLCAILYSNTLLILVIVFVKNVLVSKLGDTWGYLATLVVIYFFARKGIKQALPTVRAWLRQKKEDYMAWKITRTQQAGALGLALLLLIPPVSSSVSTGLVLEPGASARIRAEVSGQVQTIYVKSGDAVKAGQLLANLHNPLLTAEADALRQQLALANSQLSTGQERYAFDSAANAVRDRTRLQQELAVAERRAAALEIRAAMHGIVATSGVEKKASG